MPLRELVEAAVVSTSARSPEVDDIRLALRCYTASMETLTISLKHIASQRDQPCAACGASFVPAEDAGSRVLSLQAPAQKAFGGLMCGGCYSKWSHGATITIRANAAG